jgi:hypothetical protein
MNHLVPALSLIVGFSPFLLAGQTHPRPPGQQQAAQADTQTQKNVPPPTVYHLAADPAKLKQEADELSRLAQSIPVDVQSIEKGMFPKDVVQKLKQIEKLSKHLRGELTP